MNPYNPKIVYEEFTEEEKEIYSGFCEQFTHGETWASYEGRPKMQGHRDKRQREYADHCFCCWRKYEKDRGIGRY